MKYLKFYISAGIIILLMILALIGFKPLIADAASCPGGANFGAGLGYGYFTCAQNSSAGEDVMPKELGSVNSASSFETAVTGNLGNGNSDSVGAAFIIDTMMGVPAGTCTGRTVCSTTVALWEKKVTAYGNAGDIKYNVTDTNWQCGVTDTMYEPATNDDVFFTLELGGSVTPCGPNASVQVIEFLNPTTKSPIFNIKIDCGNPIGTLSALPDISTDTMSGSVQVKNTTTGALTNVPNGTVITLSNESDTTATPVTATVENGTYSISVTDGEQFGLAAPTAPSGESGPYTDYQGGGNFTDAATGTGAPYNCGTTNYLLQVAGGTSSPPNNSERTGSSICKTIGNNKSYNFIYTGTSTTGGCTTNCGGSSGAPTLTCTQGGTYSVTSTLYPGTTYIGAGFPASISFSTTPNFGSDANYGISLGNYPNQTSQLIIEENSGLGITSNTYYPNGQNIIAGSLPIQTPAGIYSVSYNATIVDVVTDPDPSAHWTVPNPNPTKVPPPPTVPYTSESISPPSAPVSQTIEVPGNPTTGYYTQETITTTYTYTNTPTIPGTTTYTCPPNWSPVAGDPSECQRTENSGKITYTPATPHTGPPTTGPPVVVATEYSYQYKYYITWVTTPSVECPPKTVQIGYQPYMKVYGGDVLAGSNFKDAGSTTCAAVPDGTTGSVIGWNWPTSSYSGAGDEFAAFGLGDIDGFATDQSSNSGGGIGLSFANTSPPGNINPGGEDFGGSFGTENCAPNFYSTMPSTTASLVPVNQLDTNSYSSNADPTTIDGGNVQDSNHPVIYVNGNVYIDGNIYLGTVPGGSWTSVSAIPSFELIVKGNIYIDPKVTNLDGIYIAQGGTIYDCATSSGPVSNSDPSFYDTCNNKLVVNGSFIATNVDFMRTGGTLYQSSNDSSAAGGGSSSNASEVFNYNPATWLGLTTNNTSLNNYNSIISLPPVL